jgi:hypothetical protein
MRSTCLAMVMLLSGVIGCTGRVSGGGLGGEGGDRDGSGGDDGGDDSGDDGMNGDAMVGGDDAAATAIEIPASVVAVLDETPYVEGSCEPTTYPGWPHEARRCSYTSGGVYAEVTTATPAPERVAAWIVDASQEIPALWELRTTDHAAWEEGLGMIAWAVMIQSGRIYPLEGDVVENLGDGYVRYYFVKGITYSCGSGCYCRINSLHRTEWCAWQAQVGADSYDGCIGKVGSSGYTEAWGGECLGAHVAAWQSDRNEHFRARAYRYQQAMGGCQAAGACSPGDVLAALEAATQ